MAANLKKTTLDRGMPISATTLSDINDLAFDGGIHNVDMFYAPRYWRKAVNSINTWKGIDFPPNKSDRDDLPDAPGVYVFFIAPNLFGLTEPSGLLYVGKAKKLSSRIAYYLGQIDTCFVESNRPYIWRMVNVWHGHLRYFYTSTTNVAEAEALEKEMLNTYRPPANKQYPAETRKRVKAFK